MIDIINVEDYESGNADILAVVIHQIKVKGNDFDTFRNELKEIFEKYEQD
jgi:hypothetical protein